MDSPYIGQIQTFGFDFAPRGWALCKGQIMSIAQNTALFSLIGTMYGGDGSQTFALPNLQGRVAIGQGQSPNTGQYPIGATGGTSNVTILTTNMPQHTHAATFTPGGGGGGGITSSLMASNKAATQSVPGTAGANAFAAPCYVGADRSVVPSLGYVADAEPTVPLAGLTVTAAPGGSGTVTVQPAGGTQPLSIQNPYVTVNYSIALQGIFPTRN